MGFAKGVAVTGKENPESMVCTNLCIRIRVSMKCVAEAHQTAVANLVKKNQ